MPSPSDNRFIQGLRAKKTQIAPYLDWVNFIILCIFGAVLLVTWNGWLSGTVALAAVTAVTAFTAIYRLRRPDETETPAVRQCFVTNENGDMDFGLRNYGPGPALYLQVLVVDSSEEPLLTIEPRERPVNLPKGEFLGLVHDERRGGDGLRKKVLDDDVGSSEKVFLHYSYVSASGAREPATIDPERDDKTILHPVKEQDKNPRRMEIKRIQNLCLE